MDSWKALAILAFCAGADAAALPQAIKVAAVDANTAILGPASASATADAAAGIAIAKPIIAKPPLVWPSIALAPIAIPSPPSVSAPAYPPAGTGVPDSELPAIEGSALPDVSIPSVSLDLPALPSVDVSLPSVSLDLPALSSVDAAIPSVSLDLPALPSVDVSIPSVSLDLPVLPSVEVSIPSVSLDLPTVPSVDASIPSISLDLPTLLSVPDLSLPAVSLPTKPTLLPVVSASKGSLSAITPLSVALPPVPTPGLPDAAAADALSKVVTLGSTVLHLVLAALAKGAGFLKHPDFAIPKVMTNFGASADADVPLDIPFDIPADFDLPSRSFRKRQILPSRASSISIPSPSALPGLGGLTGTLPLGGLTGTTLGGGSDPLSGVLGGVTAPLAGTLGGVTAPLAGTVGGVTAPLAGIVGSVTAPLAGTVGSVTAPLAGTVGGVTAPLAGTVGGVTAPLSGLTGGALGGILPVSSAAAATPSPSPSANPNINPLPFTGIPGTDPVGAFSISVIATLLSLLKKDPMSLFAPSLPIGPLVKRDLPELHRAGIPELAKRQAPGLPSLSSGISGVGIGGLPLSGVPGVSPDLGFLVGSIAKNIAVPGGTGLGSVTSSILATLNGVVPNFLFQLPVVQDSVPTFGVLQLLASINPVKFKDLAPLTSLSALQQAASGISAGDLAFIRTLPASPDPTNLISTIMTLSDNILSLPGYVTNLKAAISVLCLKNLGLAVPGL